MYRMLNKVLNRGTVTGSSQQHASGSPMRDAQKCTSCGACINSCPWKALDGNGNCDLTKCRACQTCSDICSTGALKPSQVYKHATQAKTGLSVSLDEKPKPSTRLELSQEIRRVLGRSLHIRHVDSGSCNGCDWEMTALLNPIHDLQSYGCDFVASPRHADLIMVTGCVSKNLEEALLSTYRCMAKPRLVMALGTCACGDGGMCAGYAARGGVDKVLPVDVYVPGCPPRPDAIIHAILGMLGRL